MSPLNSRSRLTAKTSVVVFEFRAYSEKMESVRKWIKKPMVTQ